MIDQKDVALYNPAMVAETCTIERSKKMLPELRFARPAVLAIALLFSSSLAVLSQEEESFQPIRRIRLQPRTADQLPLQGENVKPVKDVSLPEHRPVDEDVWRSLKVFAESDSRVKEPDAIVEIAGGRKSGTSTLFPGLGFQQIHPPDTTVAKSSSRILQTVNSVIWLFDAAGNLLHGRTLADFFGTNAIPIPPFDPKVLYDRNSANPRLYVVATQYDFGPPQDSRIFIAVSRSSNPSDLNPSSWCHYSFSTTFDSGATPSFLDQPSIGVGADSFVLGGNQHTISSAQFTFATLYAFVKSDLANCLMPAGAFFRPASSAGDLTTFNLQPVLHYNSPSSFAGTSNPAYMISNHWPAGTVYRVWRLRNLTSSPQLQVVNVSSNYYTLPPDAPQAGTSILLETNDARVLQAGGVGNSLWAAHSTNCNIGGGGNESCARIIRFNVGQNASGNPTATIGQQTTFGGGANVFYWMPGIAVNQSQRTVVPFLFSSASSFLSSGWSAKDSAAASYPAAQTLASGTCARTESTPTVRTGDYVGAQTNPNDFTSFWISAEHASVYPPPPAGNFCTWQTDILQVN